MFTISWRYLNALNLLEIGFIILCIFICVLCKRTSWLMLPLLMCISNSILCAIVVVIGLVLAIFAPSTGKNDLLLPMIKFALETRCTLEFRGLDPASLPSNAIIVLNYPASFIEYLIIPMLLHKAGKQFHIVAGYRASIWAEMFVSKQSVIRLKKDNNFEQLKDRLATCPGIVLLYPERDFMARKSVNEIRPLRTGVFEIVKAIGKPLYVGHISHVSHILGVVTTDTLALALESADDVDPETTHKQLLKMAKNVTLENW